MNWSSDSLILSSWPCTRQSCCWSHSSTCWSGSSGRIIGSSHSALSFEFSLKNLAIFLFQSLLSILKQCDIRNVKYIYDLLTCLVLGFLVLRRLQCCQYHQHCPLLLDPADRNEIDFQEQQFFAHKWKQDCWHCQYLRCYYHWEEEMSRRLLLNMYPTEVG